MTSPLDEILKRLEQLELRMARLEAAARLDRPVSQASNANAFASSAPRPGAGEPAAARDSAAYHKAEPSQIVARTPAAADRPATAGPEATAPITERLTPVTLVAAGADPFPDLSMLDEKLEAKKGPAEVVQVRAAVEDYPRIATRIQQLWGTPECEAYLTNLVIDTRGNRKGFPPPMMEELLYLGRLARALVILSVGGDRWSTYDQVGDRR